MPINVPRDILWPPAFQPPPEQDDKEKWDALAAWLSVFLDQVTLLASTSRLDLEVGSATHRIVASAPAVGDLADGEIIFMDDESSVRRLYTKLNGTLRYVALT